MDEDKSIDKIIPTLSLNDGFFPPPWNVNELTEKTGGWIEFQKAMRSDPKYYLEDFKWTKR